jgi:hypothetical protein
MVPRLCSGSSLYFQAGCRPRWSTHCQSSRKPSRPGCPSGSTVSQPRRQKRGGKEPGQKSWDTEAFIEYKANNLRGDECRSPVTQVLCNSDTVTAAKGAFSIPGTVLRAFSHYEVPMKWVLLLPSSLRR